MARAEDLRDLMSAAPVASCCWHDVRFGAGRTGSAPAVAAMRFDSGTQAA